MFDLYEVRNATLKQFPIKLRTWFRVTRKTFGIIVGYQCLTSMRSGQYYVYGLATKM